MKKNMSRIFNCFKNCFSEHHKYNINPKKYTKKLSIVRGKLIKELLEKEYDLDLKNANVLDLGCGFGEVSYYFTDKSKNVVGFDITLSQLKGIKHRNIKNLNLIHGNAGNLPFKNSSFDIVIVCGVLEWVAYDKQSNVKHIQLKILKEMNRILKNGGILYLGIENRFGLNALLGGPEHHTGLPFVSILPRKLADVYCKLFSGKKYRTYTYSKGKLEKMLTSAGFYSKFYTAIPSYGYPKICIKLNKEDLIPALKKIPNLKYAGYKGKVVSKIAIILTFLGIFKELPFNWVVAGKKVGPPNCFIKCSKKREYFALKRLSKIDIKIPEPYYFDHELGILSMRLFKGKELTKILRDPGISKLDKEKIIIKIAKWLGKLHFLTLEKRKVSENFIKNIIKKYSGSEIKDYEKFYKKNVSLIAGKENIFCQIHGDFNAKNVIIKNNNISVIDFECSGYGLPLMDVYRFIIGLEIIGCFNPFLSVNFRKKLSNIFLKTYFNTTKFEFSENLKKIIEFHAYRCWYNGCEHACRLKGNFLSKLLFYAFKKRLEKKLSQMTEV